MILYVTRKLTFEVDKHQNKKGNANKSKHKANKGSNNNNNNNKIKKKGWTEQGKILAYT